MGLIGNCQAAALVHRSGDIAWCCLPRFDSEPIFARLLDPEGGTFRIAPVDQSPGVQRYLANTNVLETTFETKTGNFRILDFMPRFRQYERIFRPTKIVRIVEPLSGTPLVEVDCQPIHGYSKNRAPRTRGSNHLDFAGFPDPVRLTTDVPMSYIAGEPFALADRRHFVLSWGEPVEESLQALCERFLSETVRYWRTWVKQTAVPSMYQQQVIRSALALKLHCFEDTGAIAAALTTSVPESPGSARTWDYRYCWLRDAYYALSAFRMLGHFEEREAFTRYLITVASRAGDTLDLAPLYRIDGASDLEERVLASWAGYQGHGPVRVGNGAALQRQHDVYGELVLALAPIFLDARFYAEQTQEVMRLLTRLGEKAVQVAGTPDSGIWEQRREPAVQTFSTLMSLAAADLIARVGEKVGDSRLVAEFGTAAARIREDISTKAFSAPLSSFVSTFGGRELDASLLQLLPLRAFPHDDPRLLSTIEVIQRELGKGGWLFRYVDDDGLGKPDVAFVICTFWLVEGLARLGQKARAREVLDLALAQLPPLGLIAEDFDPVERRMWGNFPQAYSHVGLIHAAFAASPPWTEIV